MKKIIIGLIFVVASWAQPSLSSAIPAVSALPLPCASTSFPNLVVLTTGTTGVYSCISGSWVFIGPGSSSGTVTSGSVNQLAWYAGNGTAVSGLATANNGILATNGSGVPSIVSTLPAANFPAVTGDVTTLIGSLNHILATVNGAPGSCGDASHVCQVTTNGKGLVTSQSAVAISVSSGTVTNVSVSPGIGGLIAISNPTTTPQISLASANSGGIPYFNSTTGWASTATLTSGMPIIGKGAGNAPVSGTISGNQTEFATVFGPTTGGHAATWDSNGNIQDSGAPPGIGTVSSVSWTGGIVAIATQTTTPAFTINGTSGGIPYFNGPTNWSSSGILTANLPVLGGGPGTSPFSGTRTGNTTTYASASGSFVSGNVVTTDINHNLIDSGVTPGGSGASTVINVTSAPYNAVCNGNSANASADTAGIQAAIDAVPSTAAAGQLPTVVQIPSGTCYINAMIKVRRNGMILRGYFGGQGHTPGQTGGSGSQSATGTRLFRSGFSGTFMQIDPADVAASSGESFPDVRGTSIQDLAIDNQGDGNPVIRVASLSGGSGKALLQNIFIINAAGTCFYVTYSGPSSSFSSFNPYQSEHIHINNVTCLTQIGSTLSAPGLLLEGADQIQVTNSVFIAQTAQTPSATRNSDVASIEIRPGNFRLIGYNTVLENNISGNYAVAIRIRGIDNTLNPVGFAGCGNNTGCSTSSDHFAPQNVRIINHHVENYNRYLVVNEELASFTRNTIYGISHDIYFDSSNTSGGTFAGSSSGGSTPVYRADLHYMEGGLVDETFFAAAFESGNPVIHMDSTTDNVLIHVPYNTGYFLSLPVIDTGANNKTEIIGGRFSFSQLPVCRNSVCSVPSTDAPKGTVIYCTDCVVSSGPGFPPSSGGAGRLLVATGTQWVGT